MGAVNGYLIGASNDFHPLILSFFLAFDHGLEDRGVITPEIGEDIADSGLNGLVSIVTLCDCFQLRVPPRGLRRTRMLRYIPYI